MKTSLSCFLGLCLAAVAAIGAETSTRKANLVVLDATGVENLRIRTAVAEPGAVEYVTVTVELRGTRVPPPGSCSMTRPAGTVA